MVNFSKHVPKLVTRSFWHLKLEILGCDTWGFQIFWLWFFKSYFVLIQHEKLLYIYVYHYHHHYSYSTIDLGPILTCSLLQFETLGFYSTWIIKFYAIHQSSYGIHENIQFKNYFPPNLPRRWGMAYHMAMWSYIYIYNYCCNVHVILFNFFKLQF
jgi:hypothetical protein